MPLYHDGARSCSARTSGRISYICSTRMGSGTMCQCTNAAMMAANQQGATQQGVLGQYREYVHREYVLGQNVAVKYV